MVFVATVFTDSEFLNTFFGAFAGAVAAFVLNACYEFSKRRAENHEALIEAQFILCAQRNDVEHVLRHIHPYREKLNRDQFVPRISYPFTDMRLGTNKLMFLARGNPNDFTEILHAQATFQNLLSGLERFDSAKLRFEDAAEYVRTSDATQRVYDVKHSEIPLIEAIGMYTNQLYELADESAVRLGNAIKLIALVGQKRFPEKGDFLKFEIVRENPRATEDARRQPII